MNVEFLFGWVDLVGAKQTPTSFKKKSRFLFFTDPHQNQVFAGTGSIGYSGDNGAATSATLYYPRGVSLDESGRILYYCLLHRYTVSSAMFDEIFFYFILIVPCPI